MCKTHPIKMATILLCQFVLLLAHTTAQVVPSNVNDLVTFEPITSTFETSPDPAGCPSGFNGKFSFMARLTPITTDMVLADLVVEVETLTNENLLLNADGGLGGVGAQLTVPEEDDFSDGVLNPGELVDVQFVICLKEREPFTFVVKVLGIGKPMLLAFSPGEIQTFLDKEKDVDSSAKFLERLPLEYKQHWIMITRTESVQRGTPTEPRLLLPSRDSSTVFGFCSAPPCRSDLDFIEYLQFDASSNKFRFHEIDFPARKVEADKAICFSCHLNPPRPNWDTYDNWANMLPFNRDRIYKGSQEEEAFIRLLEHLENDPIIKQLKLPEGVTRDRDTGLITIPPNDCDDTDPTTPDVCDTRDKTVSYTEENGLPKYTGCNPATDAGCKGVTVRQGGPYLLIRHSPAATEADEGRGVELFDNFSAYNARRVAQELLAFQNNPMNPKNVDIRPIALAITKRCVNANNLSDFASQQAQAAFRTYHKVSSFAELLTKTSDARRSLPKKKGDLQALNLKGLIDANNASPPAPPDPFAGSIDPNADNITKEVAQRSLEQRHVEQGAELDTLLTKFMIEREDERDETTIALFRFFLEPWDVGAFPWVQRWSMGVNGLGGFRSDTYTFADVFSTYRKEIQRRLEEPPPVGLGPGIPCTGADSLATMSMRAFDAALPLPSSVMP